MPKRATKSGAYLWSVQALLLGVASWLFLEERSARSLAQGNTDLLVALFLCGALGLAARGTRASWTSAASVLALIACGWLALPFCQEVVERAFGPWFHTLGCFVANLGPLVVLGSLAFSRRPRFGFVLGFAVAMASVGWRLPHAYLALSIFLLARDMGRDTQAPRRQHFALVGVGLLAATFVCGLCFDLAATLAYGDGFTRWGGAAGYLGDAPLSRWLRMITEAALVAACFAYSRGRTWGVLALSALLPLLFVQLALLFVSGEDLPGWSSGGCFYERHPFERVEHIPMALLITFVPWVFPIVRVLVKPAASSARVADGKSE